jgi:HD superfamily phosphohydrolase YqeK
MSSGSGITAQGGMPPWAVVSPRRAEHVTRVVAVLEGWAMAMGVDGAERERWARAGWLHDALRDAPEADMRELLPGNTDPLPLLHGPAAAVRASREGERDAQVLEAVRWHTVGNVEWGQVGRVLYAADFLEPGRPFSREERGALARRFPDDPERVLREVVMLRTLHQQQRGRPEHPMSAAFRAAVCS